MFASSGGALVGLDLIARHPGKVRALVAHEPPLVQLLPDAAEHQARAREVHDIYLRHGVAAAMQRFMDGAGLSRPAAPGKAEPQREPTPEMKEGMKRMGRNLELFIVHGVRQIGGFMPDFAALKAGSTRIAVAAGENSGPQLAQRAAVALAQRLGTPVIHFPGDHGGFTTHPEAFARTLNQVLSGG